MAFDQEINGASPTTGAVAVWTLVQSWVAAGAAVVGDSDGTTYNATGGQVTSGAGGAGGLGNTNAWVRVRFRNGREMTWQRGSSNTQWRVKYSEAAQFSGGSPSATQTPTATDGQTRCGGGTDASPTFVTLFATDATYKLYGCADSVKDAFWYACTLTSNQTQSGGMIFAPCVNEAGTVITTAITVALAGATFSSANIGNTGASATSSGTMGWMYYGTGSASYAALPSVTISGYPNDSGQDPTDSLHLLRMIEHDRKASLGAPVGYAGKNAAACWNSTSRSAKELYLVGGTAYRICFGDANLPFVSSVVE